MATSAEIDRTGSRSADTRERLLDAAEVLFAERGFDGTSMRALAQAAGASLSAAHYHFGSKDALVQAALRRRIEPINQRRLELLEAAERAAGHSPPSVEEVLEAFVRPVLEARAAADPPVPWRGRLAVRLYYDPFVAARLRGELLRPVQERFVAALQRSLPDRSRRDVELAHQLTMGMLLHVISGQVDAVAGDQRPAFEPLLARIVSYAAAGLRAAPYESFLQGDARRGAS